MHISESQKKHYTILKAQRQKAPSSAHPRLALKTYFHDTALGNKALSQKEERRKERVIEKESKLIAKEKGGVVVIGEVEIEISRIEFLVDLLIEQGVYLLI